MNLPTTHLCLLLCVLAGMATGEEVAAPVASGLESITVDELFEDVSHFASDEFEGRGRGTKGHDLARDQLAKRFEELGLEPAGDEGSYLHEIISVSRRRETSTVVGHNVLGILPGADEELGSEIVIVSAHYDHLGIMDDKVMNGADDNASGLAALLEIAEAVTGLEGEARPRRSILFAAWDLEENGLLGSMYWTQEPTRPLEDVAFMISMDMLSRSFLGVLESSLFVLGTEHSADVAVAVEAVGEEEGLNLVKVGSDLVGSRSDHWYFMDSGVPYLFFTTGTQKHYHSPEDDADSIDRPLLHACTRYIYRIVEHVTQADTRPAFAEEPLRSIAEIEQIREILNQVIEKRDTFVEKEGLFEQVEGIRTQLDGIIALGEITEDTRTMLKALAGMVVLQLEEK